MNIYRFLAWPLLARLDPERAHTLVLRLLAMAQETPGTLAVIKRLCAVRDPRLEVGAFGLRFPNPVGLAAGLDKDARATASFAALGFGAVEVGTVTPVGQPGNPRPRIFRLPAERALINRMGFPNQGAARARARLRRAPRPLPGGAILGGNLGKNASTPLEAAVRDYVTVLDTLHDLADYAVVNVSSPNTKGLRSLQERSALEALLKAVVARRDSFAAPRVAPHSRPAASHRHPERSEGSAPSASAALAEVDRSVGQETDPSLALGMKGGAPRTTREGSGPHTNTLPVLVKVAPDLDWHQLAAVVEAVRATRVDGIVGTNTTLSREGVSGRRKQEAGGLSGEPLRARSTEIVRWLAKETGGTLPIVGVGGISHPDHALEKLDAGAALVQVYTGLIYAGPTLPARICRELLQRRSRGV